MAFKLSEKFLSKYADKQPEWGYGTLSYFTYKRTYSRMMKSGVQEEFFDTLKRVTEGTFLVQEKHCKSSGLPWNAYQAQKTAQIFFQKMWEFKFLPPGRGLWMMGTEIVDKIGSAGLNNCGYVSSKDIKIELAAPFVWAMDMLMLGVGIGFDTKGAGTLVIKHPKEAKIIYEIPDTREGWVESVRLLLNSYQGGNSVEFTYDKIRLFGTPIKGFGGKASGPQPLIDLHDSVKEMLSKMIGEPITSVMIVDIMNFIGKCVVAGNVRRAAEIGIGEIDDDEYIEMKSPAKFGEELTDRRWASNNSVFAKKDSDFDSVVDNIVANGEPGLIFLKNAKHYGRTKDGWAPFESERYDDVQGFNPCVTKDSWVQTSEGPKQVEELIGKEFVALVDGKEHKASGFWKTGTKKTHKLVTKHGYELRLTENHKILTKGGEWVEAGSLKKGDKVVIHNHQGHTSWGATNEQERGICFAKQHGIEGCKEAECRSSSFYDGYLCFLLDDYSTCYSPNVEALRTIQRMLLRIGKPSSLIETIDDGVVGLHKMNDDCKYHWATFIELIPDAVEDVYDVTVEDVHAFDANGLYVHNCVEQGLENYELCCLVETFPANHDDAEEYIETLKYAYLYSKSVTLIPTHEERTNAVMMRNRRIGCSMSGIQQAFKKFGHSAFLNDFCDAGYQSIKGWDRIYSRWLGVPRSIKMTTVKPSGCQRKDTLISTDKGLLTLEEIGDVNGIKWQDHNISVMSDEGVPKQSTKYYVNGLVDTKKIVTSDGVELESSHNHKYRILTTDGEYLWRRADELAVGDSLVVKLGTHFTEAVPDLLSLEEGDVNYNTKEIRTPACMNEDLAWFLGLMYGDGSVHKKGIRISFNRKQPALVKWVIDYADREFGIGAQVDDDHSVYLNSSALLAWLKKNGLLKSFSYDISIPKIVRSSRKEIATAFIDGYWRADGGIHNLSNWTVCSVSESFARQFLQLCRSVGFNVKIACAGPGGLGSRDRWIVQNRGTEPNRYQGREFRDRFWNGFWLDPIASIEDSRCETFDIEVPDGNTYIANGVVSHNTVSILAGATPGIHFTHSEYYMRTVRCSASSPLVQRVRDAGYRVEYSVNDKKLLKKCMKEEYPTDAKTVKDFITGFQSDEEVFQAFAQGGGTVVIYFPVKEKSFTKSKFEVSVWEQVLAIREMQHYWSDNGVSCTITFNKDEAKDLQRVIEFSAPYVKSLSFLPLTDHSYEQAPYQECSKEEWAEYSKTLKAVDFTESEETEIAGSKFCDGDQCEI
jgi:intein/homing endonuclease